MSAKRDVRIILFYVHMKMLGEFTLISTNILDGEFLCAQNISNTFSNTKLFYGYSP